MQVLAERLYHVYNQGNNQEIIFHTKADYVQFLRHVREKILPHCKIMNEITGNKNDSWGMLFLKKKGRQK